MTYAKTNANVVTLFPSYISSSIIMEKSFFPVARVIEILESPIFIQSDAILLIKNDFSVAPFVHYIISLK